MPGFRTADTSSHRSRQWIGQRGDLFEPSAIAPIVPAPSVKRSTNAASWPAAQRRRRRHWRRELCRVAANRCCHRVRAPHFRARIRRARSRAATRAAADALHQASTSANVPSPVPGEIRPSRHSSSEPFSPQALMSARPHRPQAGSRRHRAPRRGRPSPRRRCCVCALPSRRDSRW